MQLIIITAAPSPTTLTIVDGTTDTGYSLLSGADWGNAVWDHQFSGARGTQGARPAQGVPQNRPLVLPIRVTGTSMDNLASKITTLGQAADELRRYGGKIKWKANGETYPQYFVVMAGTAGISEWGTRAENIYRAVVLLQAACAPYLIGDAMDIRDDFSTDTLATDYTFDTGSGTIAVSSGQLAASTSAEKRFYHSARGYTYSDVQITLKFTTGASIGTTNVEVMARRINANNFLYGAVYDDGATRALSVTKYETGAIETTLATTAISALAVNTTYWLRFRLEGNVLTSELFTSEPTPMASPTTSTTPYSLATVPADATKFGTGIAGQAGIRIASNNTVARYDDFRVEPFTYRNRTLPERIPLNGTIPGDTTALADITVTPSGGSAAPVFAMLGWSQRALTDNLVWNGDFEDDTNGWSVAGVTGVTGAATSITRVTTAAKVKYGTAAADIVTPATANTGASFAIYRRFRKGVTYTAELYTYSAAGTTNTRLRLGVSGDISSETATALSSTLTRRTVTWTPTADVDLAYVAFEVTAATATTMAIDGVMVYEGTTAPTLTSQSYGAGGQPPFGILEAESADTGDLTGWAITASGSARSGYHLTSASATSAAAGWWIDPNTLAPDDYTMSELLLEVWARVQVDNAATSPRYLLSVIPEAGTNYGNARYTMEYGSVGKLITKPSSSTAYRLVRLGTLPVTVDRTYPRRWKLWLAYTATGANTSSVDYLIVLPARQRALSPTGKVLDTTYPKFVASTNETSRTIRSDLSGLTAKPPGNPHPDTGLGGELLEIPYGNVDALIKLSSLSPDDPTSDTTTEQLAHSATVHLAVTPRWMLLRGAS